VNLIQFTFGFYLWLLCSQVFCFFTNIWKNKKCTGGWEMPFFLFQSLNFYF